MPRPEPELRGAKGIICARRAVRFLRSRARIRSSNATNFSSFKNPQIKNSPVKTSKTVIIANDNDILNFLLIRCKNRKRTFVRFLYYTAKFAVCQPFFKIFCFLRPISASNQARPKGQISKGKQTILFGGAVKDRRPRACLKNMRCKPKSCRRFLV